MKNSIFSLLILSLAMILTACGDGSNSGNENNENASNSNSNTNNGDIDLNVGLAADVGGVNDKSFNQSAWEGLQKWGEEHGLKKGEDYDYAQSDSDSEYVPNIQSLIRQDYNMIYGIGFKLKSAITDMAEQYPEKKFGIIDTAIDKDNVVSILFADNQNGFLAGIAAGLKTNTDEIGFVGGEESDTIESFEAGYRAGAKTINPDINIDVQYAGGFNRADKGKLIASSMYDQNHDVIFEASGNTGNGVFNEARDIKKNDPEREIWAIGTDRDYYEEGQVGGNNITLTSALKRVGKAIQNVNNETMQGNFQGGKTLKLGLESGSIGLAKTNKEAMTDDILNTIDEWKNKIIDGKVEVPNTIDELKTYLDNL